MEGCDFTLGEWFDDPKVAMQLEVLDRARLGSNPHVGAELDRATHSHPPASCSPRPCLHMAVQLPCIDASAVLHPCRWCKRSSDATSRDSPGLPCMSLHRMTCPATSLV